METAGTRGAGRFVVGGRIMGAGRFGSVRLERSVCYSYMERGHSMFGKVVRGWVMITLQPIDLTRNVSGPFIGRFLLVVPNIFAGIYARWIPPKPVIAAFWLSSMSVVAERILIYVIGALLVGGGGDGSMDGITTMMFIRGEAAPYYTVAYIRLGVFSILLAMLTAAVGGVWQRGGIGRFRIPGR